MTDPFGRFAADALAPTLNCPLAAIDAAWPHVMYALDAKGIGDEPVQIAALATIALETAHTFAPVREAFWLSEDWRRANLRYYPWYGRGLLQLTWPDNYRWLGEKPEVNLDLVDNPDLVLNISVSAWSLAYFFLERGVAEAARAAFPDGDWSQTRIIVNGGLNGWQEYAEAIEALKALPTPTAPAEPSPEPPAPPDPRAAVTARYEALVASLKGIASARPYRPPSRRRILEIVNA